MEIVKMVDNVTVKRKWKEEEARDIPTLSNSTLRISRIAYDGVNPPKRCLSLSKHEKTLAFDIELVPIAIVSMIMLTPENMIPNEEFRNILKKLKTVVMSG